MATGVPASPVQEIPKEKLMLNAEITTFQKEQLQHSECQEKVLTPQDLVTLRSQEQTINKITEFNRKSLSHTETEVKDTLPNASDIAREKLPDVAKEFDHSKLKHVEPKVENSLPTAQDLKECKEVEK